MKVMKIENTNKTLHQKRLLKQPTTADATKANPTDRDRQLVGLLGVVRYLSTEQLCRLFYDGRNSHNMRKRLLRLAGKGDLAFRRAFIRRLFYRTYEGERREMWTLTGAGYVLAATVLDTIIKVPRHDVGAAFREHAIVLNELFVALIMPPRGGYARARQTQFRWIPSDTVRLPWKQNLGHGSTTPDRLVLPDAVLEIPSAKRRLFVECEMGTHPIANPARPKPGSTIAKVQNYEGYLCSYVDTSATQTFYARSYPDNYVPEVLFLVRTAHRAKTVNEAIRQWQQRLGTQTCPARALTVEGAQDELLGVLRSQTNRDQRDATVSSERPLSLEDIATLRRFYNGTVLAFKEMRAKARAQREAPPAYPPMVEEMQTLVERLYSVSGG